MNRLKRFERSGKHGIRALLGHILKPASVNADDFDRKAVKKVLLVRQDSRLGNLVLMTPLIAAVKKMFPNARLDVLISEGFESVLTRNRCVDNLIVFRKSRARTNPFWCFGFIRRLRRERYDLAVDVSDGSHFSFNNVLLTSLTGAKFRLGYAREDARIFLNILAPKPPDAVHMADAMTGLVRFLVPETPEPSMVFPLYDEEREFAAGWLEAHDIGELDSYFVIHPGGRGKKQWGKDNFALLIDRIGAEIGVQVVVIGGKAEENLIRGIAERTNVPLHILGNVSVGQMAAVIEKCDVFISNDTGPMHVASALGRPTIGIFVTSNARKYGPRGVLGRTVDGAGNRPSVDEVMTAIVDVIGDKEL